MIIISSTVLNSFMNKSIGNTNVVSYLLLLLSNTIQM